MRTFVRMREYLLSKPEHLDLSDIKQQIKNLQEDIEVLERDHEDYEKHFDDIYLALAQMAVKNKESNSRKPIGFIRSKE